MEQTNIVICGANSYEEKFYLNPKFARLPQSIKEELQIMCVLYTNDIGGILTVEIDEDGYIQFRTKAKEADYTYDEIGSYLKIKELQRTKEELLRSLELYYHLVICKDPDWQPAARED